MVLGVVVYRKFNNNYHEANFAVLVFGVSGIDTFPICIGGSAIQWPFQIRKAGRYN